MYTLSNGTELIIGELLGGGGEGEVFETDFSIGNTEFVFKKFSRGVSDSQKSKSKIAERRKKIEFLSKNRPLFRPNSHNSLVWPHDLVEENKEFIGYIMPKVSGEELEILCDVNTIELDDYKNSRWNKYSFNKPEGVINRLKLGYKIAEAVDLIHQMQQYVLVDLKPTNILVDSNDEVNIIDLDSIQITGQKNGFKSSVITPDYAPPERKKEKTHDWDKFSLAVILYKLLLGIHPFSGTLHPPHDNLNDNEGKIKNGFFPLGSKKSNFKIVQQQHSKLYRWYPELVDTFLMIFDTYLLKKIHLRPSAKDWMNIISISFKPSIKFFKSDKSFSLPNAPIVLSWSVKKADKIEIDNGVGVVTGNKTIININKSSVFKLKASNSFGSIFSEDITIATLEFETPKSIFIPAPELSLTVSLNTPTQFKEIPTINFRNNSHSRIDRTQLNAVGGIDKPLFKLSETSNKRMSLIDDMKLNYEWTNTLLDNVDYKLSFNEYFKYRIYKWIKEIKKAISSFQINQ